MNVEDAINKLTAAGWNHNEALRQLTDICQQLFDELEGRVHALEKLANYRDDACPRAECTPSYCHFPDPTWPGCWQQRSIQEAREDGLI